MAMIKCHECGNDVSSEADTCPKCGVRPKSKTNIAKTIIGAAFLIGLVAFLFGGGVELQAEKDLDKIANQVASDAVQQYEIAKRGGDKIQICVQAGFVVAAYLQAKDEPNYNAWKATQRADCKRAGMPI